MTQKMNKFNSLKKTTKVDFATYLGVIVVFIITTILQNNGSLKRSAHRSARPHLRYMSMAVSLNLTVGILGELSLGHAGFMSVGAFSGIVASQSLMGAIPNAPVRLAISMVVGAIFAAIVGLLIGTPVLRLQATTSPSSRWPSARSSKSSSTASSSATMKTACTSSSTPPATRRSMTSA